MDFRTFKNSRRGLWVGRGLVSVGVVAMCVCVYFNARHGWNLSTVFADQVALATMHGLVDIATALLVSAGAILFAWHARKMGFVACVFALVLTSFSVLSVSGFMSVRIVGLESQKATLDALEKHGKWTGGTAYQRAGYRERRSLRLEMQQNLREMVKVASMVPDSHAVIVANMTGWNLEFVQRLLILISSGMAQVIKYICLLVGFWLLSNRDERIAEPASQNNSGGSDGSKGSSGSKDGSDERGSTGEPGKGLRIAYSNSPEPANPRATEAGSTRLSHFEPDKVSSGLPRNPGQAAPTRKLSRDEVWDRLRRQADGREAKKSSWQNARDFGLPQRTIYRWQKRLNGQAKSQIKRFAGNGGGYHTPAYN